MRRGSYFFVIDAFIAAIIILGAVVALYSDFLDRPSEIQSLYTAEDFLLFLEGSAVRDVDSALLRAWAANGTINDTGRSMLDQLAQFTMRAMPDERALLGTLALEGVPEQVNIRLLVDGSHIAERSVHPSDESEVFFSSKRIILPVSDPPALGQPVLVEVQTWQ